MTSLPLRYPRKARGRTLPHACLAALAIASVGAGVSSAHAADPVACSSLPNAIYGIGGSAATNLIKRIGARLASSKVNPITVVYSDPGACQAMTALVPKADGTVTPLSGTGKYWVGTTELNCTYDGTINASWGAMAQEATTCSGIDALPATVGDYTGPISGFSLIVPLASTEVSISSQAVYYIYGFGAVEGKLVAPWTVPAAIGSRTTTSAAGLLLAKAVGIPTSQALAFLPTNDAAFATTTSTPSTLPTPAAASCRPSSTSFTSSSEPSAGPAGWRSTSLPSASTSK